MEWAVLMQRSFGFDSLRCPKCDHKMRVLATILEPAAVRKILDHLGVRADPLPRAPARDPTGQTGFDFDAA
jgi:DNA-directed RNA polymerase subunit H (RpoH/RPB5)